MNILNNTYKLNLNNKSSKLDDKNVENLKLSQTINDHIRNEKSLNESLIYKNEKILKH